MKRAFFPIAVFLFSAVAVAAQDAIPTPTPVDEGDVVKISTTLIQIDVTVTDRKGNIVRDLSPDEIEIYENGKKQQISNFSFVSNARTEAEKPTKRDKENAIVTPPSTPPRPEKVRRTIALVVDDLTLSFESTYWVQQALKKFVNEQMQDGDLVAIIRTGGGIGALQQFTTDKRQLLAAIQKVKFNLRGPAKIGVFNPITSSLNEELDYGEETARDEAFEREANEFRENIFTSGTLGALNFIVRGMSDLPGRKSVMLLSDGFRLITRNDRGLPQFSRIFDSLQRLIDFANRSSVVFYTLDARGLVVVAATAQDEVTDIFGISLDAKLAARANELRDTQDGLRYLAENTGGFAIINSNNISHGIRRVLDDQSYYLVGYEPDGETFDPRTRRYNKLEVKVKREGVRVRYRSGFFGFSEDEIKKPQLNASQSLLNALTSPFAINDISLHLNALFLGGEKETLFLRSYLHINAGDLKFTKEPDGTYQTKFNLVALSFGDNGVVIDEYGKSHTVNIREDAYRKVQEKGFVYHFTFPVKKAGGYQMRVAVQDELGGKVGSANQFVDIPNLKKKKLTLSGIVFENVSIEQWQTIASNPAAYEEIKKSTDPMTDTSLRQFRNNSVVRFGTEIYNPKLGPTRNPDLTIQLRIFQDGKVVVEGQPTSLSAPFNPATRSVSITGSLRLGDKMQPGDYILQIIVTDNLAKQKHKTTTQFVHFEVIE
jgi:VWFA-related protein